MTPRVQAMSRDPALYDNLALSLAPSVWEMEDVKKGLLLQVRCFTAVLYSKVSHLYKGLQWLADLLFLTCLGLCSK